MARKIGPSRRPARRRPRREIVAIDTPCSVPPSQSGAPKVFSIAPATGSGTRPLTSAKATSGLRRAGSSPRASSALAAISWAVCSSAACAAFAARRRCASSASSLAIKSLSVVACCGELGRALLLRAERVFGRGQRCLARLDQRGQARLLERERSAGSARVRRARARSTPASSTRSSMSRPSASISRFQCGDHRAEQRSPRAPPPPCRCGLTRIAGGGFAPMRCSAARTSAIAPRRPSSERASASALALRLVRRSSAAATPRSASCTLAVVVDQRRSEPRAVGADRFDLRLRWRRRCSSEARSVSSTPAQFAFLSRPAAAPSRRGCGTRRDRRAPPAGQTQRGAERGGAEAHQSHASPSRLIDHRCRVPRSSNLADIAAIKRDDRDGRKESKPPGKAARSAITRTS